MGDNETGNANRERIAELRGKGLSVREIAALMGMSTQGVYWHLARLDDNDSEKASA